MKTETDEKNIDFDSVLITPWGALDFVRNSLAQATCVSDRTREAVWVDTIGRKILEENNWANVIALSAHNTRKHLN